MHWIRVGDVDLLECASCDGTWIEADAFDKLCTQRDQQAALAHKPIDMKEPRAASSAPAPEVRYRPCPRCGKMMNRQNFGRLSGTIVDVCKGHGTYLDAGELHAIVRFIRGGGLDRARQRQIEELKEEQRRLEATQAGHRHSVGGDIEVSWSLNDVQLLIDHITDK